MDAIVVGGLDFGEADRIVRLLTRSGRLSVFAHGARKSRRRFGGALEPFTSLVVQLDQRRRKGMPALASVSVTDARLGLQSELQKIALAAYVAELGAAVAPEADPCDGIFELVTMALDHLVTHEASVALQRVFEAHLITCLGMAPTLSSCAVCGGDLNDVARIDLAAGGALCEVHGAGARRVGPKTIEWLTRVLAARQLDALAGLDAVWADTAARKLGGAFVDFFGGLVSRPLRSADLLAEALG